MPNEPRQPGSPDLRRRLASVAAVVVGLALAVAGSRLAVSRFWTWSGGSGDERFPWGTPLTEQGARTFEEVMGSLILAVLICPFLAGTVLPWLRGLRRPAVPAGGEAP